MKKKKYKQPTMRVVQLKQRQRLLTGSGEAAAPTSASFDDYKDGGTVTWDE